MTDDDIALIRTTFAHLHRRKAETAEIFYARLFEIAPETRQLFPTDMTAQGVKLMETLTVAIATLHDRDGLTALLKRLGRQHEAFGVKDKHYVQVGDALLWTLRRSLGEAYSMQAGFAWERLYAHIAKVMIEGARGA